MIPRLFTKYLINDNDFTIEYGTVDRCMPNYIYVSCKTYLHLIENDEEYNYEMKDILKEFRRKVKNIIKKSQFEDDFILSYDFANDIVTEFKNKILTFDLFIKQKEENFVKPKLLADDILNLTSILKIPLKESLNSHNIYFSKAKQK